MSKIISGFPGIGKSYLFNNNNKLRIKDSDSSQFDKVNFPANYINHIKSIIDDYDIILVSSHDVVRKALKDNGINYTVVVPDIHIKKEYINRYHKRKSPKKLISLIDDNFYDWVIDIIKNEPNVKTLKKGQYLSDVIDDI